MRALTLLVSLYLTAAAAAAAGMIHGSEIFEVVN